MNQASGLKVALVIARRELIRFLRQPARVAAAIGTPAILWLFLGSGFAQAFRPAALGETSYAAFLLPGMMTLVAVFTAIFSSISIIEDRNEGWLQAALVAPVPRWSIALGKIFGGAILAFAQAALLLIAAGFVGIRMNGLEMLAAMLGLAFTCLGMTGLGVMFAWRSETSAGFHAVMNLVFAPMWMLSGAFFPPPEPTGAGLSVLSWLMWINPLTWCTQAIRAPMLNEMESLWPLGGAMMFALAMLFAATAIVSRPGSGVRG